MKIWKIYTLEENNICLTAEEEEYEKLYEYYFEGESVKNIWDESLKLDVDKRKTYDKDSDFLCFSDSFFVVSKDAINLFKERAGDNFEILNFNYEKGEYYILNVCKIIDCIDMEKSKYKTYKKNADRILKYEKLFLNSEKIGKNKLFILKHHEGGLIACTDELKIAIEHAGLYGVGFELLDECN